MIQFIKSLFSVDTDELIAAGAYVIDIRPAAEYEKGHLKLAVNIPVNTLRYRMPRIEKRTPIIVCGEKKAGNHVKDILKANEYTEVYVITEWGKLRKHGVVGTLWD